MLRQINCVADWIRQGVCDAVSFHGRRLSHGLGARYCFEHEYITLDYREDLDEFQREFLQPVTCGYDHRYRNFLFRWHEGCLAYLAGPQARAKWLAAGHGYGMPCDLFLDNELSTWVMRHTIFHHDQRYGSLIADAGLAVGA